jgi:hypothetical protein
MGSPASTVGVVVNGGEGEELPGYSARDRLLEAAMLTPAAYSIYSAALHADWHSIIGNWMEARDCSRWAASRAASGYPAASIENAGDESDEVFR